MASAGWTVGIDEVGRGALAGPVVVAAAAIARGATVRNRALGKLRDSKKLSAAKREAWCAFFAGHPGVAFALARVYPHEIDRRNISNAANLAAARAFARLSRRRALASDTPVFLDGGLFLGRRSARGASSASGTGPRVVKTVVRGDERITAVKIASIIAKVHRDRLMCRLARRYPRYRFDVHKGYGTERHRAAIRRCGLSPAHRLTFAGKSSTIRT